MEHGKNLKEISERLGNWSQDPSELLMVLCEIGFCLRPGTPIETINRKINFLAFEAKTKIISNDSPLEKMRCLGQFFFFEKNFKCLHIEKHFSTGDYIVDHVLQDRSSSSLVISVLIRSIAAEVGVDCEVISLKRNYVLKFRQDDKSYFLTPLRQGEIVCCTTLLDVLNQIYGDGKAPSMDCLVALSERQILQHYFEALYEVVRFEENDEIQLAVLCLTLSMEPSNIKVLGERGLLYSKVGAKKQALTDLKRYFSFVPPETSPQLFETYSRLQADLSVNPKNFEVLVSTPS